MCVCVFVLLLFFNFVLPCLVKVYKKQTNICRLSGDINMRK